MYTTWISLESIMLCERGQSQKTSCGFSIFMWFHLYEISRIENCGDQKETSDRLRLTVLGENGDGLLMDMGLLLGD